MSEPKTFTLEVPNGTLSYDVRGDLSGRTAERALLLAGFPMDATGFTTLATYFTDRPVITYDPSTIGRSRGSYGDRPLTAEDHAEDLHHLVGALDIGPVDLLGSSGGAVNGLAFVSRHPDQVSTFVAHEPPIAGVLPDRDQQLAVLADISETYRVSGMGPAMAKFLAVAAQKGPLPGDYLDQPAPDPGAFGLPTDDDGSRDDPMLAGSIRTLPQYEPDFGSLAAASTRIVMAAGEESEGEMPARAAAGVAERLGLELVVFPSHHGGFLGGEFGQQGDPEGFAAALRKVLDEG